MRLLLQIAVTTNFSLLLLGPCLPASPSPGDRPGWFKGNTHTHTWMSDGDSTPEAVIDWYARHGYQFLVLSDHDLLTLVESRLLLVPGEEITDNFQDRPLHVNGINLRSVIRPRGGRTAFDTLQNDINAVADQAAQTGRPMLTQVNHPNFRWACTAEDITALSGSWLMEMFNGNSGSRNYGDADHPSAERLWDIVLTRRLTDLNLPIVYGTAGDDAHHFDPDAEGGCDPGRGWVMVRAARLRPDDLAMAMQQGDFYASTGVLLDDVQFRDNTLEIRIWDRPDVSYRTQFIGTLTGYQAARAAAGAASDQANPEIGKVLAEQSGPYAAYHLTGQEIYVRAKVISTATPQNPYQEGDVEAAWVQPVRPAR